MSEKLGIRELPLFNNVQPTRKPTPVSYNKKLKATTHTASHQSAPAAVAAMKKVSKPYKMWTVMSHIKNIKQLSQGIFLAKQFKEHLLIFLSYGSAFLQMQLLLSKEPIDDDHHQDMVTALISLTLYLSLLVIAQPHRADKWKFLPAGKHWCVRA